ncbi:MAG: TfoX/Sxy family protein [Flavobacteriales bacterium]|nr:TfoX/Sxy family protein [Flavobacteriales bacterium]
METDQYLLERLRNTLKQSGTVFTEKKMFGGNCFMVDDKMCFGTYKGGLMVRIHPDETDELIKVNGAGEMIHGGRPMKGYLFVQPEGYDNDDSLSFWINKCLEFNPIARSSKK